MKNILRFIVLMGYVLLLYTLGIYMVGCDGLPAPVDCVNYDCEDKCWVAHWVWNEQLGRYVVVQREVPCG